MTSVQKKKLRRRNAMVIVYVLAVIGLWTVGMNVYTAGKSAVNYVQSWINDLEWSTPTLVQSQD